MMISMMSSWSEDKPIVARVSAGKRRACDCGRLLCRLRVRFGKALVSCKKPEGPSDSVQLAKIFPIINNMIFAFDMFDTCRLA